MNLSIVPLPFLLQSTSHMWSSWSSVPQQKGKLKFIVWIVKVYGLLGLQGHKVRFAGHLMDRVQDFSIGNNGESLVTCLTRPCLYFLQPRNSTSEARWHHKWNSWGMLPYTFLQVDENPSCSPIWDADPELPLVTLRSIYKMPMANRLNNHPGFPGSERFPGMQEFQCYN